MNDERDAILPFRNPLREAIQRESASDDLGVARCPLCDGPLRVRMDRAGPRFTCACERPLQRAG